jgi:predicted DNA-binding transcriptional regulator AlpA
MQNRTRIKVKPLPPPVSAKKRPPRLIDRAEIMYRIPVTWPTLQLRMQEGVFPLYRRFGDKLLWLESEVDAFIEGTYVPRGDKVEA